LQQYEPFQSTGENTCSDSEDGARRSLNRPQRGSQPLIAAALLRGMMFSFEPVQKSLETFRFNGRRLGGFEIKDQSLSCSVGNEIIVLMLMPAPYPWCDLEGPCHTSWMWPEGKSAMDVKAHQSHVLIRVVGGNSPPIDRHQLLTQLAAACAQQPETMAIYWPYATLVHEPKLFVEMAKGSEGVAPLFLSVDYRVFRNEDGSTGLFTTGLDPLGLMELEIPSIDMKPGELREWAMNISGYMLENGPVLKDGDTVGMSAEQKIRIRHCKSQYNRELTVIRMEL
jgi:hypothetical protein